MYEIGEALRTLRLKKGKYSRGTEKRRSKILEEKKRSGRFYKLTSWQVGNHGRRKTPFQKNLGKKKRRLPQSPGTIKDLQGLMRG